MFYPYHTVSSFPSTSSISTLWAYHLWRLCFLLRFSFRIEWLYLWRVYSVYLGLNFPYLWRMLPWTAFSPHLSLGISLICKDLIAKSCPIETLTLFSGTDSIQWLIDTQVIKILSLVPAWVSQVVLMVKTLPTYEGDIRDSSSVPGSGRSPGGGHGNPLQYSCLENPMDRGAWWATVHGVAKSQAWLKWLSTCTCPKVEQLWKAVSSLKLPLGSTEDIVETTWQTSLCCVWLLVTPWTVSTPGFPILPYLLELAQIPVHWIGDAI